MLGLSMQHTFAMPLPAAPARITVATLNLLNDMRRWPERRELVAAGFRALQPDLIALQEVVLPLNTAAWLADQLEGYALVITPKTSARGGRGARGGHGEGLALLSRLPVQSMQWLALGSQRRVAQFMHVDAHGAGLLLANTHLHWSLHQSPARLRQVHVLQAWLAGWQSQNPECAVVVCGDLNATPGSRVIRQMKTQFRSAHALVHGREPIWTCPTPLQFTTQRWRRTVMTLAGVRRRQDGPYWRDTLDYVFVSPGVTVHDCHVVFDAHAMNDATLYASDHLGLMASLELTQMENIF